MIVLSDILSSTVSYFVFYTKGGFRCRHDSIALKVALHYEIWSVDQLKGQIRYKFYPIHTVQSHLKNSTVDSKTRWDTYLDVALCNQELMLLGTAAVALKAALHDRIWS